MMFFDYDGEPLRLGFIEAQGKKFNLDRAGCVRDLEFYRGHDHEYKVYRRDGTWMYEVKVK